MKKPAKFRQFPENVAEILSRPAQNSVSDGYWNIFGQVSNCSLINVSQAADIQIVVILSSWT
jgi:hypothetical protein